MRLGLQEKLLIPTVCVFALGAATAVYFVYVHTTHGLEAAIQQSLVVETRRTAKQMDLRIQAGKLEVDSWGAREGTVAALQDRGYFGRNVRRSAAAELVNLRRNHDFYDFIAIVDRNGDTVAASSKLPTDSRRFLSQKFFMEAMAGERVVTPVFESPVSGKKMFVVATPVRGKDGTVGVVVGGIRVDSFRACFLDTFTPADGGIAYLAAADGQVISVSNHQQLPFKDLKTQTFGRTILDQAEGSIRHEMNGEIWLSSFARSQENGMIYVASACGRGASGGAYKAVRLALMACIATVVVAALVAMRVFRRKVSSRLDNMLRVFERAEAGELDAEIDDQEMCPDEISKLINVFNSMLGKLRSSQAELYREVEHRRTANERRKALIAELEVKNSELERFTYTVSHDLKSPLITIKGFLGAMRQDFLRSDFERCQQDIQRVEQAADKMVQLLEDLLELSRIGRLANEPASGSFHLLTEEAVALLESQIGERGVEVVYPEEDVEVYGDLARLREALQNLIDNAVKYMGDQKAPRVVIGIDRNERETVFSVTDNGVGIDEKYHDKVFDLFNQLDPSSPGSGVGLAIVKRIIELHDGRVWIAGNDADQGTRICFTLAPRPEPSKSLNKS